jgi:hypothetical protein
LRAGSKKGGDIAAALIFWYESCQPQPLIGFPQQFLRLLSSAAFAGQLALQVDGGFDGNI